MAKKNNTGAKILGGALIAGTLGVVAGMLLAPKSGKKLRHDLEKTVAGFYKYVAPQLKKLKNVSESEYKNVVHKAVLAYGKARKLSTSEMKVLKDNVESIWKHAKKHL